MTRTGAVRRRYAEQIEPRPSRLDPAYPAWADRADAWGIHLPLPLTIPEEDA